MAPNFARFVTNPWRTACYNRCKPSTRKRMDSALRTQLLPVFGSLRLDEINRVAVLRWFDGYSRTAPAGANRTLDILRQILNYGIECGHLESNPACGVKRNPRPKVTRFLSKDEVARVHATIDAHRGRGSRSPSKPTSFACCCGRMPQGRNPESAVEGSGRQRTAFDRQQDGTQNRPS